jgi:hypothetical protein
VAGGEDEEAKEDIDARSVYIGNVSRFRFLRSLRS